MDNKGIRRLVKELNELNPEITFAKARIGQENVIIFIGKAGGHNVYAPNGYEFVTGVGIAETDRAKSYYEQYRVLVMDRSHWL